MTKVLPRVVIEEHIDHSKVSEGRITQNSVDIIMNQENEPVKAKARRSFIGVGDKAVAVEFDLELNTVDGDKLIEVIAELQATGQDMVHVPLETIEDDGPSFESSVSISFFDKEYYVPLDKEVAKKAINASGIIILKNMSNQEIVDKVKALV